MRIYKKKYYLMEHIGSNQGRWPKTNPFIVTGHKACNNKSYVLEEYIPTGQGMFRCADGHGPDYQPQAPEAEALQWLDQNRFAYITEV